MLRPHRSRIAGPRSCALERPGRPESAGPRTSGAWLSSALCKRSRVMMAFARDASPYRSAWTRPAAPRTRALCRLGAAGQPTPASAGAYRRSSSRTRCSPQDRAGPRGINELARSSRSLADRQSRTRRPGSVRAASGATGSLDAGACRAAAAATSSNACAVLIRPAPGLGVPLHARTTLGDSGYYLSSEASSEIFPAAALRARAPVEQQGFHSCRLGV